MVVLSSSGVLPFCPTYLHEHRQDIAYPTGCHLSSFQLVSGYYPCADRRVPSTRTTGAVTDASGHSVIRSNSQAKEGRRHHPDVSCPLCLCRTASPTASARHTNISFSFEAASARHMRLYRSNSFYRIHAHRKLKILLLLLSSLLSSAWCRLLHFALRFHCPDPGCHAGRRIALAVTTEPCTVRAARCPLITSSECACVFLQQFCLVFLVHFRSPIES